MAEMDFTSQPEPTNAETSSKTGRRKKRGWIFKIGAAVIVGLILLVLVAPTLLSSGPVVSVLLGQVNKQLNGKVEVASLSLGWFTGIKADGMRILDASGAQIGELDHAAVPYALWKPITGNFALGDILIDGLSLDARTDSTGVLNFQQLVKPKTNHPSAPGAETTSSESKPSKLPNISANLKLTNCHGTFSQPGKPTVYLTALQGHLSIPNINQPITEQFNAAVKLDDEPEGTLLIDGSAAVINQNQIALDSAEIHQTIDLANLDLQAMQPLIPTSAGVSTLDGVLGLHLSLDLTDGKNATVDAAITADKPIAFGGKVLQGDTFKTNTLEANIPKLTADFPEGLDHWQSGRIKVGSGAGLSPILLKIDQGQVTVLADLMPQAILNLIGNKKPGSDGQLVVTSSFDLAGIIPQLRHTIPEAEGVLIKSAGLTENLKLVLSPDKAELFNSADSTPATGTQTLADGQTKPISIPAIHLSVSGADLGGNGGSLPDLHGLDLKIQSAFANGDFQGQSLSDLHGSLTANLQTLQSELGQFIDLSKINLGGDLSVDITGSGNLTEAPAYQASVKAAVSLHDFKYGNAAGRHIDEPLTQLVISADLQGGADTTLRSAKNVSISLMMGDAGAPTVSVAAEAPTLQFIGGTTGAFNLSRFSVDLGKLQSQLAAVPAGSTGVVVNQGVLSIASTGQFSAHHLSIDSLGINADNLFVSRQLAGGQQIQAISGEAAHLNLAADVDTSSGVITISSAALQSRLATASISNGLISLSGESVFDQLQSAHCQVNVPDLKPVMDLVDAFSPPAQTATSAQATPQLQIDSGAIALTGEVSHDANILNFNLSDLTVTQAAFTRGEDHYAAKPADVKLLASIQTGDGKQLLEQIRQIQITQLTGDLGIATLSMPTLISVSQLSSNPIASGGISVAGNLTNLTQLLSAIGGKKPDAYPYRGDYRLTENIATRQSTISLKGGMQIAKFQSYNGSAITSSEDLVNIANDLSVTSAGGDQSIDIASFTAAMQSSGAANVSLSHGSIAHLNSTRDMQLQVNVNYDLAKLWPIVQPMMGEQYKTLKIAGQFQKQLNVTGSYPANLRSTDAIKTLHADGDLAVASFDYDGLSLQNFIVPLTLNQGHLLTVYANKPAGQNSAPPAAANGGTLDLANLDIDLTQDPPRLSTPRTTQLISQVTINPLFAQSYLAKVLNNPLFSGAQQASGLLDLSLVDCDQLPLGDLVNRAVPANTGKADLLFSLTNLNIGVQGLSGLASALKQDSFTANINNGAVSVAHGISTQHIVFAAGKYSLDFDGKVRLADEAFIPLKLSMGPLSGIFSSFGVHDSNLLRNLPDRIVVPVEGTVSHARVRLDKAFGKATKDAAAKAITNGLFGGNKNGGNNNPLGGLLKGLQKNQ